MNLLSLPVTTEAFGRKKSVPVWLVAPGETEAEKSVEFKASQGYPVRLCVYRLLELAGEMAQ